MKRNIFTLVAALFLSLGHTIAQESNQLSDDIQKLRLQETKVQKSMDSVQNLLNTKRNLFENGQQSDDKLTDEIINLEGLVFDFRSKLSVLGSQIATLQAERSKQIQENRSDAGAATDGGSSNSTNLFANSFFVSNLTKADQELFAQSSKVLSLLSSGESQINELYGKLKEFEQVYQTTQSQDVIDNIIKESAVLKSQIAQTDAQISEAWQRYYNRKLDNYLVLTDKLNSVDRSTLEKLDALSREALHMEHENANALTPSISAFASQQALLLEYESLFAQKLKMPAALDAINAAKKKLQARVVPEYKDIQFPYKSLVIYAPITLGNTYSYSDIKDVPALKLPEKGAYYAVQVALTNSTASSLSIFKGAEPLQLEQTATGQHRYVLGGFKSYAEGVDAVKECFKAGFKNPILVAWVNGQFTTATKAKAYQEANPDVSPSDDFKVVVVATKAEVGAVVKSTIDINSPGKTILRTQEGSNFLYTIAAFKTKEEAQVVAQIIKTKSMDVESAEVSTVGN